MAANGERMVRRTAILQRSLPVVWALPDIGNRYRKGSDQHGNARCGPAKIHRYAQPLPACGPVQKAGAFMASCPIAITGVRLVRWREAIATGKDVISLRPSRRMSMHCSRHSIRITDEAGWKKYAIANLAGVRRIARGKPVYCSVAAIS